MAALDNLTKSADIATTARVITFLTRFNDDWSGIRDLLGVTRPIRRAPGTVLKAKQATVSLHTGEVDEGDIIPLSKAGVIEIPYGTIAIKKWAKSVSLEAIDAHGYDDAILRTDREFRRQLVSGVQTKFYDYLKEGTLTGAADTFQMAIAKAEGLVRNKWDSMNKGLTEIVGFCNIMDAYEYLGAAGISTQTQFGMEYLQNFLGLRRLFLTSKIPAGTILATPVDNVIMYYVDPADSDFARAGLSYMAYGDIPGVPSAALNLVGFHVEGDYSRATSNSYAIMGIQLFAEYIDGIAAVDIGTESFSAVSSPTGNPAALKYYEKDSSGHYFRTTDTEVDSSKTYYSRTVTAGE